MNISSTIFEDRREKLRAKLTRDGLSALLVSHAANRYYLSGFELHDPQCNESAGYVLITASGRDYLLTDPRYLDAARRLWPEGDIFIYSSVRNARMRDFLAGLNLFTIGFEARSVSYAMYEELKEAVTLKPVTGLVEELRLVKDGFEIAAMERSCALNHAVMASLADQLAPGQSESEIAWSIEQAFRNKGATELAFSPIVAVNQNAALPHAIPGGTRTREDCLVLVDVGARYGDYCSDQTRTFWVGEEASPRFKRTMEQVREAQVKAIEAMRPGLPIAEAYHLAKGVFEKHHVADYFTHALGHGIGLETHEGPSVGPLAKGEFKPGMIVTVEPGLYYPEWGGIRWEYMVLITEDGARTL